MGLFTEDLERADADVKVPATIVEGPVSPQTPTSPTEVETATNNSSMSADEKRKNTRVGGEVEEEDDDDDLFKGN